MRRWLWLLVLTAPVIAGCAGSSDGSVSANDLPAALREADRHLGAVESAMARCPEPPATSLEIPPSIVKRLQRDSYFDPMVRSWAEGTIRAQERLNACRQPALADAIPESDRARRLAHEPDPTELVSLEFLDAFGSVASRTQDWVVAEGALNTYLADASATIRATLDAFAQFSEDIEAGAFPTDAELQLAAQERLSPHTDAFRDVQAEAFELRRRNEDAVSALRRAERLLDEELERDENLTRVARALADADPEGYFGQVLPTPSS